MKWIKYASSGFAILLLTTLVLLFPTAYQQYSLQKGSEIRFRELNLEPTEQKLTQRQVLRLLCDNVANNVWSEVQNNKTTLEYKQDCKDILRAVFGEESSGKLTVLLLDQLENSKTSTVKTFKFLTLSGDDIIDLNLVLARFGNLCLFYEEETKAALQIAVYDDRIESSDPYAVNEYTSGLEGGENPFAYYDSLGMEDWEFDCYAYNSPSGKKLFVGLREMEKMDQYFMEMDADKEMQN
ncbi:MAG: hypothetical protein ACOX6U_06475 [Oscillospiraceae bacterium]|jgi:hypothetical protein